MKYLTGLFNSKLIEFWLKNKGKMQGDNFQLDKAPLLQIPIKNSQREQEIISIVDQISKYDGTQEKINYLEKKLNSIVYETYNLNNKEIAIIEKN